MLYEDDGRSFDYRRGEWMGIQLRWKDAGRTFTLHLAEGSKMLAPLHRNLEVKVGTDVRRLEFNGRPLEVKL